MFLLSLTFISKVYLILDSSQYWHRPRGYLLIYFTAGLKRELSLGAFIFATRMHLFQVTM